MSTNGPLTVFAYGSLMFDRVWSRVVAGRYRRDDATVDGWHRFAVDGEAYPAVVARPGATVRGVLWHGVDARDVERLDAFEGDDYARVPVVARLDDGRRVDAWLYAWRRSDGLAAADWDVDRFARGGGLERFLASYCAARGV